MDRGLRERRAQIRAQKRAERLEAREKRTRSVRKADLDEDPAFFSYTPEGVTKKKESRRMAFEKGRNVLLTEFDADSAASGRSSSSGRTSSSIKPDMDLSLNAVKRRVDAEKKAQADAEEKAQKMNAISNRKYGYQNYDANQPVYNPDLTMEENLREQANKKMTDEFKQNSKRYGYEFAQETLNKDRESLENRVNLDKIDEDAQKEYLQERADQVAQEKADAERIALEDQEKADAERAAKEAQEAKFRKEEKARADEEAYAKEMEQTKYNIMRDNAGKFLRSFAQAGVDDLDRVNTAGWDMAGNMVKAMFTRPEALSSASRVIGSAMSMNEAVGRMAEDTSKRYGIAVQADPELIKDTIKYKAYKRAKDIDGKVMGNAMKALDDSLRSLGVEDVSQLDESQLASYRNNVEGEMERIRGLLQTDQKVRTEAREGGLLAEIKDGFEGLRGDFRKNKYNYNRPDWNGRLHSDDRTMLMRTYDVLTDHVKELDKHANQLSKEEKARVMEARRLDKERRMRAYDTSPIGFVLKELSPDFRLEVGQDGLPRNLRDYSKVENMIARMEADDRAAYGDDDALWRHTAAEYKAARDLMEKSRDDIFKTKNADSIAAYDASPYKWALHVAFPNYTVAIDPNTGLPSDYDRIKDVENTIRNLMTRDQYAMKNGAKPERSMKEYQDALDSISGYKRQVKEKQATSQVQHMGPFMESVARAVPNSAQSIIYASNDGIWGSHASAVNKYAHQEMVKRWNFLKSAGKDPTTDYEYVAAYCLYQNTLLSTKVTKLGGRISAIPPRVLREKGISKEESDRDISSLYAMMNVFSKYHPVDNRAAHNINWKQAKAVEDQFEMILKKMDDKYRIASKGGKGNGGNIYNNGARNYLTIVNRYGRSRPNQFRLGRGKFVNSGGNNNTTNPNPNPQPHTRTAKQQLLGPRQMLGHLEKDPDVKRLANELSDAYNSLASGDDGDKSAFTAKYGEMYSHIMNKLESNARDWYTALDPDEKHLMILGLVDRYTGFGNSDLNYTLKFLPNTYGVAEGHPGLRIDTQRYGLKGEGGNWNTHLIDALYSRDPATGEFVPKNPMLAAADLFRIGGADPKHPRGFLSYEDALDWVNEYMYNMDVEKFYSVDPQVTEYFLNLDGYLEGSNVTDDVSEKGRIEFPKNTDEFMERLKKYYNGDEESAKRFIEENIWSDPNSGEMYRNGSLLLKKRDMNKLLKDMFGGSPSQNVTYRKSDPFETSPDNHRGRRRTIQENLNNPFTQNWIDDRLKNAISGMPSDGVFGNLNEKDAVSITFDDLYNLLGAMNVDENGNPVIENTQLIKVPYMNRIIKALVKEHGNKFALVDDKNKSLRLTEGTLNNWNQARLNNINLAKEREMWDRISKSIGEYTLPPGLGDEAFTPEQLENMMEEISGNPAQADGTLRGILDEIIRSNGIQKYDAESNANYKSAWDSFMNKVRPTISERYLESRLGDDALDDGFTGLYSDKIPAYLSNALFDYLKQVRPDSKLDSASSLDNMINAWLKEFAEAEASEKGSGATTLDKLVGNLSEGNEALGKYLRRYAMSTRAPYEIPKEKKKEKKVEEEEERKVEEEGEGELEPEDATNNNWKEGGIWDQRDKIDLSNEKLSDKLHEDYKKFQKKNSKSTKDKTAGVVNGIVDDTLKEYEGALKRVFKEGYITEENEGVERGKILLEIRKGLREHKFRRRDVGDSFDKHVKEVVRGSIEGYIRDAFFKSLYTKNSGLHDLYEYTKGLREMDNDSIDLTKVRYKDPVRSGITFNENGLPTLTPEKLREILIGLHIADKARQDAINSLFDDIENPKSEAELKERQAQKEAALAKLDEYNRAQSNEIILDENDDPMSDFID